MFGGFHQVPSPTNYLNQAALTAAARGMTGVPTRSPYANNPNAFINRLRDPGFVSHYDTRGAGPPRTGHNPLSRRQPRLQPQSQRASILASNPILPLASFFDASKTLVWPGGSPDGGELKEKRVLSDQASLAVFVETQQQPVASLSMRDVRPQEAARVRPAGAARPARSSTPAIADAFHLFLLSLYDSLAQAADPPQIIPPAPPPR